MPWFIYEWLRKFEYENDCPGLANLTILILGIIAIIIYLIIKIKEN